MPGKHRVFFDFFWSVFLWSFLITALLGVNYCQEDYDFGSQISLNDETPTPTATGSPTASPTEGADDTATPTASGSPTASPTPTVGASAVLLRSLHPAPHPMTNRAAAPSLAKKGDWLGQLAREKVVATPLVMTTPIPSITPTIGGDPVIKSGNWLGQIGQK